MIFYIKNRKTQKEKPFFKEQKNQTYGRVETAKDVVLLLYFATTTRSAQDKWERLTNKEKKCLMEQINRIELKGNVGNIRIKTVGDNTVANFSLATNYLYTGKNGEGVVETTWFNVVAWGGKGMPDFKNITKGMPLHVTGRMRTAKFNGNDGEEKTIYEVVANRVSTVEA